MVKWEYKYLVPCLIYWIRGKYFRFWYVFLKKNWNRIRKWKVTFWLLLKVNFLIYWRVYFLTDNLHTYLLLFSIDKIMLYLLTVAGRVHTFIFLVVAFRYCHFFAWIVSLLDEGWLFPITRTWGFTSSPEPLMSRIPSFKKFSTVGR